MGFFNKLEDETKNLLSNVDDGVNDTIGWEGVAAIIAMMMGIPMPTGGAEGSAAASTGFEWLPSGEMTVFNPETAGATGGSSNWLSGLFGGSSGTTSGEFIPDLSGQSIYEDIGIDPESSGLDINSPLSDPAEQYYDYKYSSPSSPSRQSQRMPDFGNLMNNQTQQQLAGLNQESPLGIKKGGQVADSVLASLLDPSVAVKAYRPSLI